MSMDMTFYVGPFLHCKWKPGAAPPEEYELTDGRLCDLRGELCSEDDDSRYIGPNIDMPAINRQMHFHRHDSMPVVLSINQGDEMAAFIDQFNVDIMTLRREFERVTVEWGVVPGYA